MRDERPTILMAGGTGLIGRQLLPRLLDKGAHVVALTRRPSGVTHPQLEELIIDFEDLAREGATALRSLPHPHVVISTLGTTIKKAGSDDAFRRVDHDYVLALASAGRALGAMKMMTVSSVGANARSRNFYLRLKGEVEDALIALGYPRLDIFRPGLLLGERDEFRLKEKVSAGLMALLNPALPSRYRSIGADSVAQAIANCVTWKSDGTYILHNAEILRAAQAK